MQRDAIRRTIRRSPALNHVLAAWHLADTAIFLLRARIGHVLTRLQQHGQKGEDSVWTRVAGRSLIATPVGRFRSVDAATEALTSLQSALGAGGLIGAVVVSPPELARVAVSSVPNALAALQTAPDNWYVHIDGRTVPLRGQTGINTTGSALVFRAWATTDGQFLAGVDVGVEIVEQGAVASTPHFPPFPVDAVITWVDGADPQWQARKDARREGITGELHETADNDARYESVDELRYCLRSIEMYAPWIRRIFLVTDNQVPAWLDSSDPRVTMVDHRDIFDNPSDLPTFNSHAIEARLHHIPGLAEHYIYFNDDLFLARALPPSFFFTAEGRLKVFLARDEIDGVPRFAADTPVVAAGKNNRELLRELTGYRLQHKLKHVPHPQLKRLAQELEELSPEIFATTTAAPFRSPHDLSVASSLLPYYALATGNAEVGPIRHIYIDVASPEYRWRLPVLEEGRDFDAVCLNATDAVARPKRGLFLF